MKKTGRAHVVIVFLFFFMSCFAHFISPARAELKATLDRTEVPQDESVSLKITQSGSETELNPKFSAPDFEIMNQFESSQFSSVYTNGKFESKSERMITFVLRPLKVGALKIRNISNGRETAPDITIHVSQENNYQKTVPGEAPSFKGDNKNFFVKAELSKARAYKGEQLIVSYYLYRRTRANLREVMQYPTFQGFIREDMEMPILSGRPEFEAVNLGGVPLERALLARYAVYPIQVGKLKIDSLSIRADYIPKNEANDRDFEDPFFQFFSQVTPRTAVSKSDPLLIEINPLPEEGRTPQFTGGVGDFEVSAQVDSNTLKANAPFTLRVTVRGKGNSSLIEFPQVDWPKNLKFYESQGKSKNIGPGKTEKTFETVLVPLQKGILEIPSISFQFFNPDSRDYITKKTDSFSIQVNEGDPGAAPSESLTENSKSSDTQATANDASQKMGFGSLRLKEESKDSSTSFLGQPEWRWMTWFGFLVLACFLGLVVYDTVKKRSKAKIDLLQNRQGVEAFWNKLIQESKNLNRTEAALSQYSKIMEEAGEHIYKTLDESFGITSRALSQRELANTLTEQHGVSPTLWPKIAEILEFSEMVRFASQSSSANQAFAEKATQLLEEAQKLCAEISKKH